MARLRSALADALAGHGRMVMLAGEPGIGKTRTAQELASEAETHGALVLWGWCYEGEGAPPYWPWVQPIRNYVRNANSGQLRSLMGPGAADIAEVIPEVRAKLPDLEPPPVLGPEQARFRLFDSLTTFLTHVSQEQPLVIVLDDLHWADQSSLLLLEFVAKGIAASRVLIVGTYRDIEVSRDRPLAQTLGGMVQEQEFSRVQLAGLTQQEVGQFVEAHVAIDLPLGVVEAIHSRTEGNPLFIREVVQLLGLRAAWGRRYGRGLPRYRLEARARGGDQGASRGAFEGQRTPATLRA